MLSRVYPDEGLARKIAKKYDKRHGEGHEVRPVTKGYQCGKPEDFTKGYTLGIDLGKEDDTGMVIAPLKDVKLSKTKVKFPKGSGHSLPDPNLLNTKKIAAGSVTSEQLLANLKPIPPKVIDSFAKFSEAMSSSMQALGKSLKYPASLNFEMSGKAPQGATLGNPPNDFVITQDHMDLVNGGLMVLSQGPVDFKAAEKTVNQKLSQHALKNTSKNGVVLFGACVFKPPEDDEVVAGQFIPMAQEQKNLTKQQIYQYVMAGQLWWLNADWSYEKGVSLEGLTSHAYKHQPTGCTIPAIYMPEMYKLAFEMHTQLVHDKVGKLYALWLIANDQPKNGLFQHYAGWLYYADANIFFNPGLAMFVDEDLFPVLPDTGTYHTGKPTPKYGLSNFPHGSKVKFIDSLPEQTWEKTKEKVKTQAVWDPLWELAEMDPSTFAILPSKKGTKELYVTCKIPYEQFGVTDEFFKILNPDTGKTHYISKDAVPDWVQNIIQQTHDLVIPAKKLSHQNLYWLVDPLYWAQLNLAPTTNPLG